MFYLEKLLLGRKLNEFHLIVEKTKVIENCYLLFEQQLPNIVSCFLSLFDNLNKLIEIHLELK
jgi:hypothetical protein